MTRRQGRRFQVPALLAALLAPLLALGSAGQTQAQPRTQAPAAKPGSPAPAKPGGLAPVAKPVGATPGAQPAVPPTPGQPGPGTAAPATPGAQTPGETADDSGEATVEPDQEALDIDALRQEYLRLRDELFRSRARAAAVSSALYSTRLRIHLDYESARFYTVTRAVIRLDGANIFDDTNGVIGSDQATRFEGFVAPGRHQLAIRIEALGKDDERFTSVIENTFTIQAPAGKDVVVHARAKDGGDIPYEWQRKQRGSYALHLDVSVDATDRGDGKRSNTVKRGK